LLYSVHAHRWRHTANVNIRQLQDCIRQQPLLTTRIAATALSIIALHVTDDAMDSLLNWHGISAIEVGHESDMIGIEPG
jgi:hypothetical protein